MATNLDLDPGLLQEAFELSGERTKKAAVTIALTEFIQRRQQQGVLEIIGIGGLDESVDYKQLRRRPHGIESIDAAE